jgi:hypothetical protein
MKFPAAAFALASAAILQNSVMALADHIYWRTARERTSCEHHFERQSRDQADAAETNFCKINGVVRIQIAMG